MPNFSWDRPPVASSPISAIVTARDNADSITAHVEGLAKELDALKREYEIFVVDDASADATAERVAELGRRFPKLRGLRHEQPQGPGAALRTGLAAARHPLVLTLPPG